VRSNEFFRIYRNFGKWRLLCSCAHSLCLHTHRLSVSQKLHSNAHFVPCESNAILRPIELRRTRTRLRPEGCDVLTADPELQMEMHFPLALVQCGRFQCRFLLQCSATGDCWNICRALAYLSLMSVCLACFWTSFAYCSSWHSIAIFALLVKDSVTRHEWKLKSKLCKYEARAL